MANVARGVWGIPVVGSTTERDTLFPTPEMHQRVQNLETGQVERWDGSEWNESAFGGMAVANVLSFAHLSHGGTDWTDAYSAAIATFGTSGGILHIPPGTYKGTVILPGQPVRVHVLGAGLGATRLTPVSASDPVIKHDPDDITTTDGTIIHGITAVAHASGGAGSYAIDVCGFRNLRLSNIGYEDNANGTGYYESLFDITSYRAGNLATFTYGITIDRPFVMGQSVGPKYVVKCHNGGIGSAGNCNVITINDPWIYANNGITGVLDLLRASQVTVRGGNIESNTGAWAIRPGTAQRFENIWFESNRLNEEIVFDAGTGDGTSNNVEFDTCYFSGNTGTITIPSGCSDIVVRNSPNAKVWSDSGTNNKIESGATETGYHVSWRRRLKNAKSGGGTFDWILPATGSPFFAGAMILYDMLANSGNSAPIVAHYPDSQGFSSHFSRKASAAAVRVVPFDDTNASTTPVLEAYDAGQNASKWKITKDGTVQFKYEYVGAGTPEGAITAPVGSIYHRTDGGAGTSFYVKESGSGNTGWVAK